MDIHDEKLSRLEATVLDMFAFMKRQLCRKGKGNGKKKVVEVEMEVEEDEDVDITSSSPIHVNSPLDNTVPYLALS